MLLLGQHWRVLRLKSAPTTMPDSFAVEVAVTIASCTFQGFWGALLATRHEFSTAVCYMAACAGSMVLEAFSVCCLVRMDLDLGLKDLHAYDDALILFPPSDLGFAGMMILGPAANMDNGTLIKLVLARLQDINLILELKKRRERWWNSGTWKKRDGGGQRQSRLLCGWEIKLK
nr:hypothetical protein Iba_chr05fCG1960 [Ipomoea batatas]